MSVEKSPDALRTIGEVADELAIPTHVLRFWESKFSQIKPQKRRGRRYYRPEDIQIIGQIKVLLYEQGYTIRGVQKFLVKQVKDGVIAPVKSEPVSISQTQSQITESNSLQRAARQASRVYDKDLFGNDIVPSGEEANDNIVLTTDEVEKLQKLYQGLCEARERLKIVA